MRNYPSASVQYKITLLNPSVQNSPVETTPKHLSKIVCHLFLDNQSLFVICLKLLANTICLPVFRFMANKMCLPCFSWQTEFVCHYPGRAQSGPACQVRGRNAQA